MTQPENDALEELKIWYRQTLSERIDALQAALKIFEEGGPGDQQVRFIAHSLRGSGATYGFPEITRTAAAVEDAAPEDIPANTRILIETLQGVSSGA